MSVRGRRPNPTALNVMRGNPGKRTKNKAEPEVPPKLPNCPKHLEGDARKEWKRMGRILLDYGMITTVDQRAFELYCTAYARWLDAERQLAQFGFVVRSPNNFPIQNPLLAIANKAMKQCQDLLVEFGMTPSSRSRVAGATQGAGAPGAARAAYLLD